MTFITHGFRVSVVLDVRERVRDFRITFALYVRKSSLVEFVSVLHGTCLQSVEIVFIHQYVQPCLSKNPKCTFYAIKSSLTLAYYLMVLRGLKSMLTAASNFWNARTDAGMTPSLKIPVIWLVNVNPGILNINLWLVDLKFFS